MALALTRSSLSSKARINGSTAPGGADCAHVSKARSRVPTSGESSSLAIHAGTTRALSESADLVDGTGVALGFPPPGTIPFPATLSVLFPETRGTGAAAWVTGVNGLLPDDGPWLEGGSAPTLARDSRLGVLSGEAYPQPASAIRSIRLRNSAGHDRDGRMFSDRSGGAKTIRCAGTGCIASRF